MVDNFWVILTSLGTKWGKRDNEYKIWLVTNGTGNYILHNSAFISIFNFSLAGNLSVYKTTQGTN